MPFSLKDTNDSGLCGHCHHSMITRGDRLQDHTIRCNWTYPAMLVRQLVSTCSEFQQKNTLDKHEMEQIGWVLEVNGGKVIGFRPPRKQE